MVNRWSLVLGASQLLRGQYCPKGMYERLLSAGHVVGRESIASQGPVWGPCVQPSLL